MSHTNVNKSSSDDDVDDTTSPPAVEEMEAEDMDRLISDQESYDNGRRPNADRVQTAAESYPTPQQGEKMDEFQSKECDDHESRVLLRKGEGSSQDHSGVDQHGEVKKLRIFSSEDLKVATENYSHFIGEGGFGSVYKGILRVAEKDIKVAVKKVIESGSDSYSKAIKTFEAERIIIPTLTHQNIISILGYCEEGPKIVYELMERGSLAEKLEKGNLDWIRRLVIANDIAMGLTYLHNDAPNAPILFRDIKPENILLNKSYNAKISDFGHAMYGRKVSGFFNDSELGATPEYSAPEYFEMFTPKSDVYSFGLLLLVLVTGKRPVDYSREQPVLAKYISEHAMMGVDVLFLADSRLKGTFSDVIFRDVISLGMNCTKLKPESRPTMKEVARDMARFISQQQDIYAKEKRANADQVPAAAEPNPGEGRKRPISQFRLKMQKEKEMREKEKETSEHKSDAVEEKPDSRPTMRDVANLKVIERWYSGGEGNKGPDI